MKRLYIGTYTEGLDTSEKTGSPGIYICQLDEDLLQVKLISTAFAGVNPSYLALGQECLYAANEKRGLAGLLPCALRRTAQSWRF